MMRVVPRIYLREPELIICANRICEHAIDRLRRFQSDESRGRWNSRLVDDFRDDRDFSSDAELLFGQIVSERSAGLTVASDGIDICNAEIYSADSIRINLRLNFLDSPFGFGQAPAQVALSLVGRLKETPFVRIRCGLSEPDGDFWYPSNNGFGNFKYQDDYNWSIDQTWAFGSRSTFH